MRCQVLKRWPDFRPLHIHSRRVFRHGLTLLETQLLLTGSRAPRQALERRISVIVDVYKVDAVLWFKDRTCLLFLLSCFLASGCSVVTS